MHSKVITMQFSSTLTAQETGCTFLLHTIIHRKSFTKKQEIFFKMLIPLYIASGGQAALLPQFYLGENKIYDKEYLRESIENSPGAKYVIIDRTSFPLGLEEGYKILDSMKVQKTLLLEKGRIRIVFGY